MNRRILVELKVKKRVEQEIAEANRVLAKKHGIDPDNPEYKKKKKVIAYAFEHRITIEEAREAMAREQRTGLAYPFDEPSGEKCRATQEKM